uniref:Uncharacterized protein n=1 Tax=Rhizophora mucronata TaxID=61149 RepID=A0A2P2P208_RHIMU
MGFIVEACFLVLCCRWWRSGRLFKGPHGLLLIESSLPSGFVG